MSAGLAALLDDIAALARLAAASIDDVGAAAARASAKAAGVVVDDAAVTPRYVAGVAADRELPMIKKIAVGSIRNKLLFILPAIMLLSQFAPWALTPLLMLGGGYLSYEGAEKLYEKLTGHEDEAPAIIDNDQDEDQMVRGAIRTDFILSAEIMVIALNEVRAETFWARLIILIVVALAITVLVYGAVGLIVKMDDIGLRMTQRKSERTQKFGAFLVRAMPKVLTALSVIGVVAMLWVGGHILLVGTHELGFTPLYDFVHFLEEQVHGIAGVGPVLAWLINTLASAVLGLIVGAIIVTVMHFIPRKSKHGTGGHGATDSSAATAVTAAGDAAPQTSRPADPDSSTDGAGGAADSDSGGDGGGGGD